MSALWRDVVMVDVTVAIFGLTMLFMLTVLVSGMCLGFVYLIVRELRRS